MRSHRAWGLALILGLSAGAAAAHEDFPEEWCGGKDCRYAEDGELNVTCGAVEVEAPEVRASVPVRQLSVWNGEAPAICAQARKLNLCNPNKGDCEGKEGLGLLIPEEQIAGILKRARAACKSRAREAITRGQSVPGLRAPRGPAPPTAPPFVVGGGARKGGEDPVDWIPETPEPPETERREIAMAPIPPIALEASAEQPPEPVPLPAPALLLAGAMVLGWVAVKRR